MLTYFVTFKSGYAVTVAATDLGEAMSFAEDEYNEVFGEDAHRLDEIDTVEPA